MKRESGLGVSFISHCKEVVLKDVVAFAYQNFVHSEVQYRRDALMADVDAPCMSDEKRVSEDNVSGNSVTLEMTGEERGNSGVNVRLNYSV